MGGGGGGGCEARGGGPLGGIDEVVVLIRNVAFYTIV